MLKKMIAIASALVITSITLMGCGSSNTMKDSKELAESEPIESEVLEQSEQEDATVENNIWEYGTTNGNAKNYSMFERRGNILYFINYGQAGSLCRMDITGEGDKFWNREFVPQVLYADGGNEINIVGDRLYFVANYDDDTKCEIISMNTDGTDIKSLYKAPIKNMIVVNNWIYFLNADNYIEKMDVNGESHEVVLAEECYYLNVYQDKLIFQLDSDNESIHSINTDGSDLKKLNNEQSYEVICNNNTGDIYYTSKSDASLEYTDRICKMKLDGTQQEIFYEGTFSSLNIHNNNLVVYENGNQTGFSVIFSELGKIGNFDNTYIYQCKQEGFTTHITDVKQICISEGSISNYFNITYEKDSEVLDGGSTAIMGILSEDTMNYSVESSYDFDPLSENE